MASNEEDKKIKPSYYSVLPAEVRYNKSLGGGDPKHLYGEISALCNEKGFCWASNKYFAELYEVDQRTVRRWLSLLEKEGYVYSQVAGVKRKIFIVKHFNKEKPPQEKSKPKSKKPAKTKTVKTKFTVLDLQLAETLLSKIILNFPTFENKKIKIEDWADDIRKLREIDKATFEQINFMIVWLHGGEINSDGRMKVIEPNDFWSKNILSAKKLRKQWFENLVPQLQDSLKKKIKKSSVGKL